MTAEKEELMKAKLKMRKRKDTMNGSCFRRRGKCNPEILGMTVQGDPTSPWDKTRHSPPSRSGSKMVLSKGEGLLGAYGDASGTVFKY